MLCPGVHEPVDCTYTVFEDGAGQRYLQIDTYGSKQRQLRGKKASRFSSGLKRSEPCIVCFRMRT
jgi:hypothetical protein